MIRERALTRYHDARACACGAGLWVPAAAVAKSEAAALLYLEALPVHAHVSLQRSATSRLRHVQCACAGQQTARAEGCCLLGFAGVARLLVPGGTGFHASWPYVPAAVHYVYSAVSLRWCYPAPQADACPDE